MTQEYKELLLKDLCARLSYGVKCKDQYGDYINVNIYNAHIEHLIDQILSGVVQMVLRPMSSMTEEERAEFYKVGGLMSHKVETNTYVLTAFSPKAYDWLNAHYFDYRGLIEKGLALKAPEGMYELKEK